jgi:hypothetical protein
MRTRTLEQKKLAQAKYNKANYRANKEKVKAYGKAYYEANKENYKAYYQANLEKNKAYSKAWRKANPEKANAYRKAWRKANREKVRASNKVWSKANPEKVRAKNKAWHKANREKVREKYRNYMKHRCETDPLFKATSAIRNCINTAISKSGYSKNSRTELILGCSFQEFKNHIESKFSNGMTWLNHGMHTWHIDHIIPMASANTMEEIIKLNHYTNLQPLWAMDNLKKGDSMNYPINNQSVCNDQPDPK